MKSIFIQVAKRRDSWMGPLHPDDMFVCVSRWSARFEQHPIWSVVQALAAGISQIDESDGVSFQQRFERVVTELRGRLESTDPELVSEETLNQLVGPIQQATTHLGTAIQQQTPAEREAQFVAADRQFDAVAQILPALPVAGTKGEIALARTAARQIREQGQKSLERLAEGVRGAEERLKQVRAEFKRVSEGLVGKEQEFADRVAEHEQRLSALQATFDTQQSERQQQFQGSLDAQRAETKKTVDDFAENSSRRVTAFEESAKLAAETFADQGVQRVKQFETKAADFMTALAKYQEDAEETLEAISTRGMAASYQEYALNQDRQASVWRIGAVTLGLFAVIALAVFLVLPAGIQPDVSLPAKSSLAATIFVVASYCARQAAGHRKEARRARDIHLRMQALPPYLARLNETERGLVLRDLAYLFFYGGDTSGEGDDGHFHPADRTVSGLMNLLQKRRGPRPDSN